ncbi:MAG: hypothetical protein CBE47_03750 [Pelagibacteraceae bacterium TMED287]|nr:MAG: hypothetical protein CBE47_03750 [Pelagibacteraceae bacterium TMED287]|tara:strand:- start:2681 stop:3745 length:1065 start_codon:yes stop_codon:yes gene_type:complete
MQQNLEFSLLSAYILFSFFIFLIIIKISPKIFGGKLLDDDFQKPQAFHSTLTPRAGGIALILSFILFIYLYKLFFSINYNEYLFLSLGLFSLGLIGDIKKEFNPTFRLLFMSIIILITINIYSLNLEKVDFIFLNNLIDNVFFLNIFLLLCFLFIINGANLIDGFNGLLGLHILIINIILFVINLNSDNMSFLMLLVSQIAILIIFLLFNFPKAKVFLGDNGSYLLGGLTSLNIIFSNNLNPGISSFFFCILLFYLFFEVFFSFFRKLYLNKSPLNPDNSHLHMLSYILLKKKFFNRDCNYLNSLLINLVYFIFISPSFLFIKNGILCRYWFFFLLIVYLIFYLKLKEKINESS